LALHLSSDSTISTDLSNSPAATPAARRPAVGRGKLNHYLPFSLEDVDQFFHGGGALVQLRLLLFHQFHFVDFLYSAGA